VPRATGVFEIESWDEAPYEELGGGAKLTKASVRQTYSGGLEAAASSESLMAYPGGDSAYYMSLERVSGRLDGRSGSFLLQGTGAYIDGTATSTWTVVPGSGTDELAGISGTGGMVATHDERNYHLDYELDVD
jgi:hypothetical protein